MVTVRILEKRLERRLTPDLKSKAPTVRKATQKQLAGASHQTN